MHRPIIGITVGDPCGIGPEIVVKSLATPEVYEFCQPLVFGGRGAIERAIAICSLDLEVNLPQNPEKFTPGTIDFVETGEPETAEFDMGRISAAGGKAACRSIERAVSAALAGKIKAIATAPINKESWKAAGVEYIGHTEMLAGLSDSADPLTMFEVGDLRIFFLSRHVSLKDACSLVTRERVRECIIRCIRALRDLGIDGVLAVAGLNPHCGEHGLFGREEVEHIEPAVHDAREKGFQVVGPISGDSVFHLAEKKYAAVLSMYHDQGHIASKTLDFERTVSLTLGLPFLRTSVDHGTAFDIAGSGKASCISMVEAIKAAARYCF